jgi:hypothetical protein
MIWIGGSLKVGRCMLHQLNIFVMSTEGFARSMMLPRLHYQYPEIWPRMTGSSGVLTTLLKRPC